MIDKIKTFLFVLVFFVSVSLTAYVAAHLFELFGGGLTGAAATVVAMSVGATVLLYIMEAVADQ